MCSKRRAKPQGLVLEEKEEEALVKKWLEKYIKSNDSKLCNLYILGI